MSDESTLQPSAIDTASVSSIGHKAGRGFGWSLLGTLGTKAGSFAIGLVLARVLSPEDFGVFAVALAAAAFLMHVNDIGVIAAGVQWRGKLETMAPTGATIALVFSLCVYAGAWFGAPAFSELSGTPQAAPVVRLLSLIIVVDGITATRSAALMRRFEQDRLTKATMIGVIASAAVSVPMAFAGCGAYSFAAGQVAGSVVTGILVFKMGSLATGYGFDKSIAKRVLLFGIPLAVSLGVESVLLNADFVIVGNVLGTTALGYYLLAYNVSNWVPGIVGTAVRYVSVSGFSRLAEGGTDNLELGVRRTMPILVSAILPFAVLLATLAPQLIEFLYGPKWSPAADVLRLLSILVVVRMVTSFCFDILTSAGATKGGLLLTAVWAICLIPALLVGTHVAGIEGTAIAHGIVGVLVATPLALIILRRIGVNAFPSIRPLVRPTVAGLAAFAAIYVILQALANSANFIQLSVGGVVGVTTYVLMVVPLDQFTRLRGQLGAPSSGM